MMKNDHDSKSNYLKFATHHSVLTLTLHVTLVLILMNILQSPIRSRPFQSPCYSRIREFLAFILIIQPVTIAASTDLGLRLDLLATGNCFSFFFYIFFIFGECARLQVDQLFSSR